LSECDDCLSRLIVRNRIQTHRLPDAGKTANKISLSLARLKDNNYSTIIELIIMPDMKRMVSTVSGHQHGLISGRIFLLTEPADYGIFTGRVKEALIGFL
jgi:hypothetical protein